MRIEHVAGCCKHPAHTKQLPIQGSIALNTSWNSVHLSLCGVTPTKVFLESFRDVSKRVI